MCDTVDFVYTTKIMSKIKSKSIIGVSFNKYMCTSVYLFIYECMRMYVNECVAYLHVYAIQISL